jgi:hypothetical protein
MSRAATILAVGLPRDSRNIKRPTSVDDSYLKPQLALSLFPARASQQVTPLAVTFVFAVAHDSFHKSDNRGSSSKHKN